MEPSIHKLLSDIVINYEIMYTQFCDIRRQLNRDNCLSPTNLENILGIGDNSLSRPALKLSVNYHQHRTCTVNFRSVKTVMFRFLQKTFRTPETFQKQNRKGIIYIRTTG